MLLWCSNGKDGCGCGRPEVPEGEGWAPSTDLRRKVSGSSHCEPRTCSGHSIPHSAQLTIQSESVAKHPIQRPLWGLEHSCKGEKT